MGLDLPPWNNEGCHAIKKVEEKEKEKGKAETLLLSQLIGEGIGPNYDDIKKIWPLSTGCCLPPPLPPAAAKEGSHLHKQNKRQPCTRRAQFREL